MTTITQTISTAPIAPSRQDPTTFADRSDAFVGYIEDLPAEINSWNTQVNTVAVEVNTNANIATASASSATLAANTTIYAAGTTYAAGARVLDPADSYTSYTSQQGSNIGHTPFTDDGTWWVKTIMLINLSGELTGNLDAQDYVISKAIFKDTGIKFVDKGNSGTTTQTLDYTAGSHQKITATGNHTIATSNWPPTGNLGELLLELVNGGDYTITWPTINWIKPDGTTTTSISTYLTANTSRAALQTSGTDFILLWSRDAGSNYYGRLV